MPSGTQNGYMMQIKIFIKERIKVCKRCYFENERCYFENEIITCSLFVVYDTAIYLGRFFSHITANNPSHAQFHNITSMLVGYSLDGVGLTFFNISLVLMVRF